jgi:nitric oxide reductase NorE protein
MMNTAQAALSGKAIGREKPGTPGYVPGHPSMWFFIIGDLLIFGVYFVSYMYYRAQHHELFQQGQQHQNQVVGTINTIVLLTSSLFVALGTEAARAGRSNEAFRLMRAAVAIGALFPIVKMVEWMPKISAGMTPGESLFFLFYYVMTGLHLCHVLLGLVILALITRDIRISNRPNIKFIETGAVYWHMVDLLWLFLLVAFYLMR